MSDIDELRARMEAAEGALRAIQAGEVDALVIDRGKGPEVYTLKSAAEPYRLLVEHMAQGALTVAPNGLILYCNNSFARILNRAREHIVGTTLRDHSAPDDRESLDKVLQDGTEPGLEIKMVRSDNEIAETYLSSAPLFIEGDEARCLIVTDLSNQDLRLRHAAVVDASNDQIYTLNARLDIRTWNSGAEAFTGLSPEDAIGLNERELWLEDRHQELEQLVKRVKMERSAITVETTRLREDGCPAELIYSLTPIMGPGDHLTGYSVVAHDITDRKRAERHREILINELNHRVRNTLAVVQSIAHQSFSGVEVPAVARKGFQDRLAALAAAHGLLTQSNWESASLKELALQTIRATVAHEQRFHFAGPPVVLNPKQALTIAMALHELCTNALKYGALSKEAGRVDIDWTISGDPRTRLKLTWRECGGPSVRPPHRRGFGSRMIEYALAHELDGEVDLEFRPEGLVCRIEGIIQASGAP